jgi:hypothetical protein
MRLLSIIVFTVVLISNTFGQTTPTTQVKTIADLVALRIPTINNRLSALVTGRVTENDGGGGVFFYEAASAVSTNWGRCSSQRLLRVGGCGSIAGRIRS